MQALQLTSSMSTDGLNGRHVGPVQCETIQVTGNTTKIFKISRKNTSPERAVVHTGDKPETCGERTQSRSSDVGNPLSSFSLLVPPVLDYPKACSPAF